MGLDLFSSFITCMLKHVDVTMWNQFDNLPCIMEIGLFLTSHAIYKYNIKITFRKMLPLPFIWREREG